MSTRVVYPGSFDPITVGHLDVIKKIERMFDDITIVVAHNEQKNYMFSHEDRSEMVERTAANLDPRIEVKQWDGMMGTLISQMDGDVVIVRGLRDNVDFHDEMMYETYTRNYGAQTIYVTPDPENVYVSSSLVRAHIQTGSFPLTYVPEDAYGYLVDTEWTL